MDKITVYQYEQYDIKTDKMVRPERFATREAIEYRQCVVREDTAKEVEISQLDEEGFLKQK